MREWDQMIARQVSADGVRTTWGEHVAPPGGEVTMTDDRILSAEEVRDILTTTRWWDAAEQERVLAHDAALRARLTAAEAQVVTLTEALREAQQCLYRDGANAAGEVKALLDAALAQENPDSPAKENER